MLNTNFNTTIKYSSTMKTIESCLPLTYAYLLQNSTVQATHFIPLAFIFHKVHILEDCVLPSLERVFCTSCIVQFIKKCFSKAGVFTQKETIREDRLPCNSFCWSTYFWLYSNYLHIS